MLSSPENEHQYDDQYNCAESYVHVLSFVAGVGVNPGLRQGDKIEDVYFMSNNMPRCKMMEIMSLKTDFAQVGGRVGKE